MAAMTKEQQRERNKIKAREYRERHPDRWRESRRKCDAKRRGKDYEPKTEKQTPKCELENEQAKKLRVRAEMMRSRMQYLKAKKEATHTQAGRANGLGELRDSSTKGAT